MYPTGNGTEVWRSSLQGTGWDGPAVWEAPVVDDIDGDGQSDMLVGTNRGPALLSADGSLEWHRNRSATYTTVVDTDGDPTLDVITAGTATVRAYDGSSGRQKWTRSVSGPRLRTAAAADEDGRAEVYVGRVGGDILAFDGRTGETEWVTSISRSEDAVVVPPVLGDVTGDGRPEVIGVTNTGTVVILDADSGDQVGRYERSVPVWTFATPADIDDDGRAEVLVRYGDGRVVALDM